jgi:hypothetical protein
MLLLAIALSAQLSPTVSGAEYKQPQLAVSRDLTAVAFGSGNAIYFAASRDGGRTFAPPVKVAQPRFVALGRHRGPRIAITPASIVISGVTGELGGGKDGDLTAWRSTDNGKTWSGGVRVNDTVSSAREGLHAMAADANGAYYAAWLDLRGKGTRLFGATSVDGGATWSKNALVYESPDGTICQCCHPSLAAGNGAVYVMWRNALGGNRDMYVAQSSDGGRTWTRGEKLGNGAWELNACPMDGGGIAIDAQGKVVTAWRRKNEIFQDRPGAPEARVGAGKDPAVAATPRGVYLAWSDAQGAVARTPSAAEPILLDPKGGYIQLAALSDGSALAAWESGGNLSFAILK